MKLTKATISGLTLPTGKQDAIFFDEELRGFGLRVRSGGKRVWVVQFQVHGHQQRRVTIGRVELFSPEEARKLAREILAKARLGQDPQREREIARAEARITLGAVAETYLKAKRGEVRPRSFRDLSRYLQKHWRPLHALPIHQVGRRDVAARLSELLPESGPGAAVRARAALSALFAWAIAQGLTEANPVVGTSQPAALRPRERVLSDAELIEVWKACGGEDDCERIIRLLVLTACRRAEVGGMRWSELDSERGTWTIPGERTKNGRTHTLPLPPMAWEIIEAVPHRAGIDLLFGRGGRRRSCADQCGSVSRRSSRRLPLSKPNRRHPPRRSRDAPACYRGCAEPCQWLPRWRRRDLQSGALSERDAGRPGDVGRSYPLAGRGRREEDRAVARSRLISPSRAVICSVSNSSTSVGEPPSY